MTSSADNLTKLLRGGLFLILLIPLVTSPTTPNYWLYARGWVIFWLIDLMLIAWAIGAYNYPQFRPRRSWLNWGVAALLAASLTALIFSVSPLKSWWGTHLRQYEAGWWALLHYGLLFLVVSSTFKSKSDWLKIFKWSVGVSLLVSLYSLAQYFNLPFTTLAVDGRVSAAFGNPIYLAVYLLFHLFLAAWLWLKEERPKYNWVYLGIILLELAVILLTKSQGVFLGLGVGVLVLVLGWFGKSNWQRWLLGIVVVLTLGATLVVALKPAPFLNLGDQSLGNRFLTWGSGIKSLIQRPLVGWGQENFNIAFEKNYNPAIYFRTGDITWFDRAHNIFIEWLVTAGFLGLLAYLFVWWALVKTFTTWSERKEQAILTGLAAAYLVQNSFLFDFNFSYLLFFLFLAFIGSQTIVFKELKQNRQPAWWLVGVVGVSLIVFSIGFGSNTISSAKWQEQAKNVNDSVVSLELTKKALKLQSPANLLLIREDKILVSLGFVAEADRLELINYYLTKLEQEIKKYSPEAPLWYRQGQLYDLRFTDTKDPADLTLAYQALIKAQELSPKRQQIAFELAHNRRLAGDTAASVKVLEQAVSLNPSLPVSRLFLGLAYLTDDQDQQGTVEIKQAFQIGYQLEADDHNRVDFLLSYYTNTLNYEMIELLYQELIKKDEEADYYVKLAAVKAELGKKEEAIEAALKAWELDYYLGDEVQLFIEQLQN
ncbi:MAG: O-antigen ligase family protein [Patescibacteria group bacterium]